MKFNREHLEELTLQKIKEVNDEAGYRSYLEVPEMVNIIATIMEDIDHNCWVNFRHTDEWEKCADSLIEFAKIIQATEDNSTRNPEYYNRACEAIETYNKLKLEAQPNE